MRIVTSVQQSNIALLINGTKKGLEISSEGNAEKLSTCYYYCSI